ncbi:MAG: hypothetical protein ACLGGX_05285 [Bdellovibrionia bacterium]
MKPNLAKKISYLLGASVATVLLFQNCSQHQFEEVDVTNLESSGSVGFPPVDELDNDAIVGHEGSGGTGGGGTGGGGTGGGGTGGGGTGGGGTGGGGTGGGGTGGGGTGGGGTTDPEDPIANNPYPKFETGFKNPPKAGDLANFYVIFLENLPSDFEADWYTADDAYKSDPANIGKPGVHYVSATGRIKILAGQKQAIYQVRSLVWDLNNTEENRIIPTRIKNCKVGGKSVMCSSIYTGINREIR